MEVIEMKTLVISIVLLGAFVLSSFAQTAVTLSSADVVRLEELHLLSQFCADSERTFTVPGLTKQLSQFMKSYGAKQDALRNRYPRLYSDTGSLSSERKLNKVVSGIGDNIMRLFEWRLHNYEGQAEMSRDVGLQAQWKQFCEWRKGVRGLPCKTALLNE
jgi:hypothetical protein